MDQNPHSTIQARHQHNFTINAWAGIAGVCLVSLYVLPIRVTGSLYFISNTHLDLLEDVPLLIQRLMWFMHDGISAHFSHIVPDALSEIYHKKWIGRERPVPWPARFPNHLASIYGAT